MKRVRVCVVCLVITALAVMPARAEVSMDVSGPAVNTLIMGIIIDDPDPFGATWEPFRSIPSERILNASGHLRGDGRPDVAYMPVIVGPQPVGFWPGVIWSYNAGSDHDLAFAEWTGTAWSTVEFLTVGTDDDLDPRIFAEADGALDIAWWTAGVVDRVFLATRPAGAAVWGAPVEVLAGGRRPSVAVSSGVLRIACERDSALPGMAQDIVVLRKETGGAFVEEFTTSTARTEALDPVLHATAARVWLDWKHGVEVFGYVEHGPSGWGAVEQPSWPDPTWVGVEETRKVIQSQVLGH